VKHRFSLGFLAGPWEDEGPRPLVLDAMFHISFTSALTLPGFTWKSLTSNRTVKSPNNPWRVTGLATCVCVLAVSVLAQKDDRVPSVDLVELDVAVRDADGRPLTGLELKDFEVKEDGKVVELKTFRPVSASGSIELDEGRSMIVVMDGVAVPPAVTNSVKAIANYLVATSGPGDDLDVVRFNNRGDEPHGDLEVALTRISEYQIGRTPFEGLRSIEDMLRLITALAQRLEVNGYGRKAIVCIGSQVVCNILQPMRTAPGTLWKDWVAALDATARANVSVYALMASRGRMPGGGLAFATGGDVFGGSSDLRPFIDRIWRDLSRHYVVSYWPSGPSKELHSISVKVNRRGARVLARTFRGY
jgi:VWFA-related protein